MALELSDGQTALSHIVVDVETLGNIPYQHHMVQLAAVAFDLDTGKVHPRTFDRCLLPIPEVFGSSPETMRWWYSDAGRLAVLNSIKTRAENAQIVMQSFSQWVIEVCGKNKPTLWVNGSGFDWLFLEAYFKVCKVYNPLAFYNVREIKSYVAGASGAIDPRTLNEKPFRDKGLKHNALADCTYQLELLLDQHRKRKVYPYEKAEFVFNKRVWDYTHPATETLDQMSANQYKDMPSSDLVDLIAADFEAKKYEASNLDDDLPF